MDSSQLGIKSLMNLYGYVLAIAAIYGVLIAHIPVLLGYEWSLCIINDLLNVPCVFAVHLYDATLVLLLSTFSWYSVRKAKPENVQSYLVFLNYAIIIEVAFFTFECTVLILNFRIEAAMWQQYLVGSIAIILLGGVIMGIYIHQKILSILQNV